MDSENNNQKKNIPQKRFTTRDVFGMLIVFTAGLLSIIFWKVFFDTVSLPDVRHVATAFFWFSLLISIFLLGTLVWKERLSRWIAPLVVFIPSFLFIQTWYHLVCIVIAAGSVFLAISQTQSDLEDRIRFRFFRHARAGSLLLIFGFALVLSSAYFSSIRSETWEELVPRFSLGQGSASFVIKTTAYLYPEWKNLADEGMTVDGFLLSLQKDDAEGGRIDPDLAALAELAEYLRQNGIAGGMYTEEEVQEAYLRSGRDQIEKLTGTPVRGDEKITDVFSLAMQHKIIAILNGQQLSNQVSPTIVPLVLSIFLFLTLISLGALITPLWLSIGFLLFQIAFFMGWVRLDRVLREQEILAP